MATRFLALSAVTSGTDTGSTWTITRPSGSEGYMDIIVIVADRSVNATPASWSASDDLGTNYATSSYLYVYRRRRESGAGDVSKTWGGVATIGAWACISVNTSGSNWSVPGAAAAADMSFSASAPWYEAVTGTNVTVDAVPEINIPMANGVLHPWVFAHVGYTTDAGYDHTHLTTWSAVEKVEGLSGTPVVSNSAGTRRIIFSIGVAEARMTQWTSPDWEFVSDVQDSSHTSLTHTAAAAIIQPPALNNAESVGWTDDTLVGGSGGGADSWQVVE
jgi:hypothetical protein